MKNSAFWNKYFWKTGNLCIANQWTGFYMISASDVKGLKHLLVSCLLNVLNNSWEKNFVFVIAIPWWNFLIHSLKGLLNSCKLQIDFKSQKTLSNVFRFKDGLPFDLVSRVVYKYTCDGCNSTYYGETDRHLDT